MDTYFVIGGKYYYKCYGSTKTLTGAKRLASKNLEYWDNWAGWKYPKIYRAEDVEKVLCRDGRKVYIPKKYASPVCVREYGGRWEAV